MRSYVVGTGALFNRLDDPEIMKAENIINLRRNILKSGKPKLYDSLDIYSRKSDGGLTYLGTINHENQVTWRKGDNARYLKPDGTLGEDVNRVYTKKVMAGNRRFQEQHAKDIANNKARSKRR